MRKRAAPPRPGLPRRQGRAVRCGTLRANLRYELKLTRTSALGKASAASAMLPTCIGQQQHPKAGRMLVCWRMGSGMACRARRRLQLQLHAAAGSVQANKQARGQDGKSGCLAGWRCVRQGGAAAGKRTTGKRTIGMAISSWPKNSFWKPPAAPGCTITATEGVLRPARAGGSARVGAVRLQLPLPPRQLCCGHARPASRLPGCLCV